MSNDMTYTEWMRAVNRVIRDITGGFSADDLVDAGGLGVLLQQGLEDAQQAHRPDAGVDGALGLVEGRRVAGPKLPVARSARPRACTAAA